MKTKVIYKDKVLTLDQFILLLKEKFANHIGFENGISLVDLLAELFEESSDWSIWRKYTYLDIIKKCIGLIRRKHGLFIINKENKFFVLKTQLEADHYKDILYRDIAGMKKSIIKADAWVDQEKWREICQEK